MLNEAERDHLTKGRRLLRRRLDMNKLEAWLISIENNRSWLAKELLKFMESSPKRRERHAKKAESVEAAINGWETNEVSQQYQDLLLKATRGISETWYIDHPVATLVSDKSSGSKPNWTWDVSDYLVDYGDDQPSCFAYTLAHTMPVDSATRLLDLGTGSGIIGIVALLDKKAAAVTFNDMQPEMLALAEKNLRPYLRSGRIKSHRIKKQPGKFREIPREVVEAHSLVAFNPPQFPEKLADPDYLKNDVYPNRAVMLFRIGGEPGSNPDGLTDVRDFCPWFAGLNLPNTKAVVTLSSLLGQSNIEEIFRQAKLNWNPPRQTEVELRDVLITPRTQELYDDPGQRADRCLKKISDECWTKHLFTYELYA